MCWNKLNIKKIYVSCKLKKFEKAVTDYLWTADMDKSTDLRHGTYTLMAIS